jgi:hypothetical protein
LLFDTECCEAVHFIILEVEVVLVVEGLYFPTLTPSHTKAYSAFDCGFIQGGGLHIVR